MSFLGVDCKIVGFFLKISEEIAESLTRASPPSLALCFQPRSRPFVLLLAIDRSIDRIYRSRVLEYAKIRTVLQSILGKFLFFFPSLIKKKLIEGERNIANDFFFGYVFTMVEWSVSSRFLLPITPRAPFVQASPSLPRRRS